MAQYESIPDEPSSMTECVNVLTEQGLLTERQAQAYVEREVFDIGRHAAADGMEISESTLDDYVRDAKEKILRAEATVDAVEKVHEHAEVEPKP